MHPLDFLVQPRLDPNVSLAEDAHFLHVVGPRSHTRAGTLRVYDFPGDVLSLGRYHLAPHRSGAGSGPHLHRRYSGGRALPFGSGFVGITLVLPHRSAFFSSDPCALAPSQVLNRYVRGILDACKLVGVEAFYPGRDFITVRGRVLGSVSFEVDRAGAMLFEGILAVGRDFSLLPAILDAADPEGVIKAALLTSGDTTCMERELHQPLRTEEVAEFLRRGYQDCFNVTLETHALTPLEERAIQATVAHEFGGDRWLRQRQLRPGLLRHAWTHVQLGMFEAFLALEQERSIGDVMVAGDFIANSPAIESLEQALRLCPAERQAIDAIVSDVFAQPGNYLLGIRDPRTVADTIVRALETGPPAE